MRHRIREIALPVNIHANQLAIDTRGALNRITAAELASFDGSWEWDRDHEKQFAVFWFVSDDPDLKSSKVRQLFAVMVDLVYSQVGSGMV